APLYLVVIYLGTNDVAERYALPAEDVAASVGRLVKVVRTSEAGRDGSAPEVLVVCPPPFGKLDPLYAQAGAKSRQLGRSFALVLCAVALYASWRRAAQRERRARVFDREAQTPDETRTRPDQ